MRGVARIAMAAALAGGLAWLVVKSGYMLSDARSRLPFLSERFHQPYHVPKDAGGVPLRLAMIHDVLLERFPKHGPAYYRERDRIARDALAKLNPDDPAAFAMVDDIAAGVERLGRSDEAAALIRDKLARQEALGLRGRDLYTSYANLGTFLIHGSFRDAMAGDPAARKRFDEGISRIRESIAVNPEAHFGRERWQAAIAEFLRASMDDPGLLTRFDCIGDRLDHEPDLTDEIVASRPYRSGFPGRLRHGDWPGLRVGIGAPEDPARWPELSPVRDSITLVGAESGWEDVAVPSHRQPVPFDEPVLGIIGMWRQGGGANPHFALALGEISLRIGQRYLAWEAFERASRLADRYWPDEAIQQALRDHCRARQLAIAGSLVTAKVGLPTDFDRKLAELEESHLRSAFDRELAGAEKYRRESQQYEEERINAGAALDDDHFFDAFHAHHPTIASSVGEEEEIVVIPDARFHAFVSARSRAIGFFAAGLAALATSIVLRWTGRSK